MLEIEKKYLVNDDFWKPLVENKYTIHQGYFMDNDLKKRIRITNTAGKLEAILGYKINLGIQDGFAVRDEHEESIDIAHGIILLSRCNKAITKLRNIVTLNGYAFEFDEFLNLDTELTLAEIELKKEDAAAYKMPNEISSFLDVSEDENFNNSTLIKSCMDSGMTVAESIISKILNR